MIPIVIDKTISEEISRLVKQRGGKLSLRDLVAEARQKGIPYAGPPVGLLRWREPAPVEPWTGVREATAYAPPCAQNTYFIPKAAQISKERKILEGKE